MDVSENAKYPPTTALSENNQQSIIAFCNTLCSDKLRSIHSVFNATVQIDTQT